MVSAARKRVGIVGVSGYGGGEILRHCARHPGVEVTYAAGESSAGQRLGERFPGLDGPAADLQIQPWQPEAVPELDLLFLSLPTGESRRAVAALPSDLKVIDVGGDHRFADGWTYGLTEVTGAEAIARTHRVADPGCFPAAALLALAPLVCRGLVEPTGVVVDAKTGISGAGRGGGSTFGFAEVNEDVSAYGLLKHVHIPEMTKTIEQLGGGGKAQLVFTPHLVPMTRGILAACHVRPPRSVGKAELDALFRDAYADEPFVEVVSTPPSTKQVLGSNQCRLHVAADERTGRVLVIAVIDNLVKGAAGQGIQAMNLCFDLPEDAGLEQLPLAP